MVQKLSRQVTTLKACHPERSIHRTSEECGVKDLMECRPRAQSNSLPESALFAPTFHEILHFAKARSG